MFPLPPRPVESCMGGVPEGIDQRWTNTQMARSAAYQVTATRARG